MYCSHCGKELPTGTATCPSCRAPATYASPPGPSGDPIVGATADLRRAVQGLVSTTARLSDELAAKAEAAAKDPSGSAKKAIHRVAQELDAVAQEIDKIVKDL
jgi:hypothetical protein